MGIVFNESFLNEEVEVIVGKADLAHGLYLIS